MMDKNQGKSVSRDVKDWVILAVDDSPDNLYVLQAALRHFGARVFTASDGAEGLKKLAEIQPNIILLDLAMPSVNGWQMFESVRGNPETAHIPIIAVTAYAMSGDRERVLRAGFNGYISKPYDIGKLVEQIQTAITPVSP